MKGERTVASLRCSEVLADLSRYLDGDLHAARRTQLEQHVTGCDACMRLGGEVASIVKALREKLGAERAPDDVAARLDDLLDKL
jgi:anti-sigma factor (TIGR02949 family)